MICVVQRVRQASVTVDGQTVGAIGVGLCVLAAAHATDTPAQVDWTAQKLATLRVFPAGDKAFDRDVKQIGGSILLVSNFTVSAETRHGRRPSFDAAAKPEPGKALIDALAAAIRKLDIPTQTGRFGADMEVVILNDGPATFLLDSRRPDAGR